MGSTERTMATTKLFIESAKASRKPHYLMNTRPGVMHREQVDLLREHGIATIGGSRQGLGAIHKLATYLQQRPDHPRAGRCIEAWHRGLSARRRAHHHQ